jgi:leucyl/phenylalanyl-tRNA---protein transferase
LNPNENKFYNLTWQQVLNGYAAGIFPMGNNYGKKDSISWFESLPRAIIPIEHSFSKLKISRSLSQVLKKNIFTVKFDTAFSEVINHCAQLRESTWINSLIIDSYTELFNHGYAHSVESWIDGKLAGGLYGVAFQGAFFGESMFHLESNASKVAAVKLYEILKLNKFILFDIQMMTPLFKQFGAINITKPSYLEILERAMSVKRKFVY